MLVGYWESHRRLLVLVFVGLDFAGFLRKCVVGVKGAIYVPAGR